MSAKKDRKKRMGRPPKGITKVPLQTRVLPETKDELERRAEEASKPRESKSIGDIIDILVTPPPAAKKTRRPAQTGRRADANLGAFAPRKRPQPNPKNRKTQENDNSKKTPD